MSEKKNCIQAIELAIEMCNQSSEETTPVSRDFLLRLLDVLKEEDQEFICGQVIETDEMIKMLKTHGFCNDDIIAILKGTQLL